jgi:hypothetical protein
MMWPALDYYDYKSLTGVRNRIVFISIIYVVRSILTGDCELVDF